MYAATTLFLLLSRFFSSKNSPAEAAATRPVRMRKMKAKRIVAFWVRELGESGRKRGKKEEVQKEKGV